MTIDKGRNGSVKNSSPIQDPLQLSGMLRRREVVVEEVQIEEVGWCRRK
jgi:hypothetical protein